MQLPTDLKTAEIDFTDTPVLQDTGVTVFQPPPVEELTVPQVVQKVEALVPPVERIVSPQVAHKNGQFTLTPKVKAEIKKLRWRKGQQEAEETKPTTLTIHQESRHVSVSGEPVSLETDAEGVRRSAAALVDYFNNYERGFVGNVPRLQRDYFTFMSWLYISPFICDLRTRATVEGGSIFRYPSFAIIYGKANCGKTSLGGYADRQHVRASEHRAERQLHAPHAARPPAELPPLSRSSSMTSPADASPTTAWRS